MTDWTAGYVADIGYTYGYYPELNPLRSHLPLLNAGFAPSGNATACELGFGQGVSLNIHAAGSRTTWFGTDFNPAQASFAQQAAAAAGTGAKLYDDAFAEFCGRSDLPEFDMISMHGIWSWVSDENRRIIVDFLRRKLKVGGVLYISYNTMPGWAAFAPLRELLTSHSETMGAPGSGLVNRIDAALEFTQKLFDTNPVYLQANPLLGDRLSKLRTQNRNYLAHEYFNRDWHPMSFARMNEWLSDAKLSYACSANYVDHVDLINLSAEQHALLNGIADPLFRQTVRDFCVNQQFRKDYWVRGGRRLNPLEKTEALRARRVLLVTDPAKVTYTIQGAAGEARLNEAIYAALIGALADHKPKTLGALEQAVADKQINFAQVMQAVMLLTSKGDLVEVQEDAMIAKVKPTCDRLNTHFIELSRGSQDMAFLASPATGGGVSVGRFNQLFLLARQQGHKKPADWAAATWRLLDAQG